MVLFKANFPKCTLIQNKEKVVSTSHEVVYSLNLMELYIFYYNFDVTTKS